MTAIRSAALGLIGVVSAAASNACFAQALLPVKASVDSQARLTHALTSPGLERLTVSDAVLRDVLQAISSEVSENRRLGSWALLGVAQLAGLGGGDAVQALDALCGQRGSVVIREAFRQGDAQAEAGLLPTLLQVLRVQALWSMNAYGDLAQLHLRGNGEVHSKQAQLLIDSWVGRGGRGEEVTLDTYLGNDIDVGETVLVWLRCKGSRIGSRVANDLRQVIFEHGQSRVLEQGSSLAPSVLAGLQNNIGLVEMLSWEMSRLLGAPIIDEVLITSVLDKKRLVRVAGHFEMDHLRATLEARGWSCRAVERGVEASALDWVLRVTNVERDDAVALDKAPRLGAAVPHVAGHVSLEAARAWLAFGREGALGLGLNLDGIGLVEAVDGMHVCLVGSMSEKESIVRRACRVAEGNRIGTSDILASEARGETLEDKILSLLAARDGRTSAHIDTQVFSRLAAQWIWDMVR